MANWTAEVTDRLVTKIEQTKSVLRPSGAEPPARVPVFGSALEVCLGPGTVVSVPYDRRALGLMLGGRGLNAQLLQASDLRIDPLDPDSPLLVTTGLLTGTIAPGATRTHVGGRSPLTGLLGSSSTGGDLGHALRSNGLGGLVIRGRAQSPVYLLIEDGHATLRDASDLWGLDTKQTADALVERHGAPAPAVLMIGPAGETGARIACLLTRRGHAAGRTGMGALMGSKLLTAVVVADGGRRPQTTPDGRAAAARYIEKLRCAPHFAEIASYGTTASIVWADDHGILATRNFRSPRFEGVAAIDGLNLDKYVGSRHSCRGCPVGCKAKVSVTDGPYAGLEGERPDFEPIVAWGSKVGVDDPAAVLYLHDLCNRLGLDSLSAGATVAFAIELFEGGVVGLEDTGGLRLGWGEVEPMERLLREMGEGHGFGGMLAGGVRFAAKVIGRNAQAFAYHVKGLELTAFDPRGAYATALGYAVSPRGGDYSAVYARHEFEMAADQARKLYGDDLASDPHSPVGKPAMVYRGIVVSAALDSLGMCKIPALTLLNQYTLESEAELASAVTGTPLSAADLFAVGERTAILERLFTQACGGLPGEDDLPVFFRDRPLMEGPAAGLTVDVRPMLREFYELSGWSPEGLPTDVTLGRLGLAGGAGRREPLAAEGPVGGAPAQGAPADLAGSRTPDFGHQTAQAAQSPGCHPAAARIGTQAAATRADEVEPSGQAKPNALPA
jgi:aldehyde:ferredoxin oxidoreductase